MRVKALIAASLIFFAGITKSYAVNEQNKTLNVNPGFVYLLSFDEKIIRYSTGSSDAVKVEILSNLYNDRNEMIVKSLKKSDTNLIIWTASNVYNFNILSDEQKEKAPVLQDFSKDSANLSDDIKNQLDGSELDKPPEIIKDSGVLDFELDKPPGS